MCVGVWVCVCACVRVRYKEADKKTAIDESCSACSVDSLAVKQSNLQGIAAVHIKAVVFLSRAFKDLSSEPE